MFGRAALAAPNLANVYQGATEVALPLMITTMVLNNYAPHRSEQAPMDIISVGIR